MSEENPSTLKWIWDQFTISWPLFFAAALTIGFASWVYGLASEAVHVDGTVTNRWQQFRAGAPNTMGDTLAGFIGSLTLIWVVASVIQQSIELRAQRREFSEMVEAQTAQVNALNKQAEIFEDEKKQREWDGIAKVLDGLLVDLARKCELLNDVSIWEFDLHEDDYSGMFDDDILRTSGPHREAAKPFAVVPQSDLDERVHQHNRSLMLFYIAMLHNDRHLRCCKRVNILFYAGVGELIDSILEQSKAASKGQQVRIASLNLESMRDHLNNILKLDLWLPKAEIGGSV